MATRTLRLGHKTVKVESLVKFLAVMAVVLTLIVGNLNYPNRVISGTGIVTVKWPLTKMLVSCELGGGKCISALEYEYSVDMLNFDSYVIKDKELFDQLPIYKPIRFRAEGRQLWPFGIPLGKSTIVSFSNADQKFN